MPYTLVYDNSTVTLAEMKTDLGITDTSLDTKITAALAVAKRQADHFIQREEFFDETTDVPEDVEEGIRELVRSRIRGGGSLALTGGVMAKRKKTGKVEIEYATPSVGTIGVDPTLAYVQMTYWAPYRRYIC
jgi:hypothetical protein